MTFIHIKNYTFKKNLKILNDLENQNLTIILENCTFEDSLCFNSIKNLTILNPNFIKEQNIYIYRSELFDYNLNIKIDLINSSGKLNLEISSAEKIELISGSCLKTLSITSSDDVIIKDLNNVIIKDFLYIKNLKLINSNMSKFKPNRNCVSTFKVFSLNHFQVTNQIHLENSKLILPRDFEVKNEHNIILKNSVIASDNTLIIHNINFIEFNDEDEESILDNSSYIEAKEIIINNQLYQKNILTIKEKKELTSTINYIKKNKKLENIPLEKRLILNYKKDDLYIKPKTKVRKK